MGTRLPGAVRSTRPASVPLRHIPHSYEPWLTWVRDDFGAHGWQHGIEYVNVNSDAGYGDAVTVDAARALIGQKVDILTTYSTAHAVMPLTGSPKG